MPTNVRRFAWLWWASSAIALIEIPLMPPPSSSELRIGMTRSIQMGIEAGVVAILVAALLPFFWLAVWRRKNWARWLLLVAFVASMPLSFVHIPNLAPSVIVLEWLSLLSEAAAFYFLFTGDARAWFRRESSNGSVGS
jgi:hypothetical protein